jgi:hypothetical protein
VGARGRLVTHNAYATQFVRALCDFGIDLGMFRVSLVACADLGP